MIYFARAGDLIKIGYTRVYVEQRLAMMRTGNPNLACIGTMDGAPHVEREIHRRFASLRVSGEWFRAESDLLAFIAESATPYEGAQDSWTSRPRLKGSRGPEPKPESERAVKIAITLDPAVMDQLQALIRAYKSRSRSSAVARAITEAHAALPRKRATKK